MINNHFFFKLSLNVYFCFIRCQLYPQQLNSIYESIIPLKYYSGYQGFQTIMDYKPLNHTFIPRKALRKKNHIWIISETLILLLLGHNFTYHLVKPLLLGLNTLWPHKPYLNEYFLILPNRRTKPRRIVFSVQGLDSDLDSEVSSLLSYGREVKNLHLISPLEYAAMLKQVRSNLGLRTLLTFILK